MIRVATSEDLSAIVAIYNEAIARGFATADIEPVTVSSRQSLFAEHEQRCHPIYVCDDGVEVKAWCSLSPYRAGRKALRFTAEISYYVRADLYRRGYASSLVQHAITECASLQIKSLIAIVLERNVASCGLLEKMKFEKWGFLPRVADFSGDECGHVYYGRRINQPNQTPEPTSTAVTPPAVAGDRASGTRGSP